MKVLAFVGALLLAPNIAMAQEEPTTLASFETRYGDYGRYRGRAHNIRRSVEFINGFVISPGERFSFNEVVGQRTRSRGFRRAPVIVNGRMERGYGGGVCQTATTVYAAALYAGLDIIEQHPHSRVAPYVPAGLDATVDWGSKDLIIENNFSFPVTLLARTYRGDRPAEERVVVDFIAAERIYEVTIRRTQRRLSGFNTVIQIDQSLEPGQRRVVEPGTPRVWVAVRRTLQAVDEEHESREERREALYEASDRIVRLGPEE